MAYVVHENQLQEVFRDLKAENPWVPDDTLLAFIVNNPDMQIMKSGKIWDTQKISDYLSDKTDEELNDIFWVTTDEWWNVVSNDKAGPTKEEKIDYSNQFDTNEYKSIWDKWMKNFDITNPAIDNLKIIASTYDTLLKKKDEITSKYDSWLWQDKEVYKQKLDAINEALAYAENSKELWDALWVIKENWMTDWDKAMERKTTSLINDMVKHRWSQMNNWNNQFQNWLYWDFRNSWFARFMDPTWDIEISAYEYDYNKKNKDKWWNNKQPEKNNNEKQPDLMEQIKNKETSADKMAFWEDVKSNEYVDKRNKILALHLFQNWIKTEEDIDKYLSQYPSYNNAKQERKDNTKKILSEKVNNIKSIWPVKEKEVKKSEDVNNNDVKWAVNENKNVGKKFDKEIKLTRPGSNWLPDMDTSINWIEEEKDDSLIYDKNWNPVWSKAKNKDTKKETKKETKKPTMKDAINIVKSSPTIKSLLKAKK